MNKILLANGTILDGTGSEPYSGDLLISGKYISQIGPPGSILPDPDCTVLNCQKKTITPGLINSHCHICCNPPLSQGAISPPDNSGLLIEATFHTTMTLQKELRSGVTYVRDCGSPANIATYAKQMVQQKIIPGPEIISCGTMLAITGGHGWTMGARECDGADEARKAAREQLKYGADFIKLMATGGYATPGVHPRAPQLLVEEMASAVQVAHAAGKKVAAHAYGVRGIKNAILAGVDSIEHGEFFDDDDPGEIRETVAMMKEKEVFWVPTLMCWFYGYQQEFGYQGEIDEQFLYRKIPRKDKTPNDPSHWQTDYFMIQQVIDGMRNIVDGGVNIALGNDAGFGFVEHNSLAFELKLMKLLGLSPLQAITAATRGSAENLGIGNAYGTLKQGNIADLLILSKDPLTDMDAFFEIEQIYKWGKPIK